MSYGDQNVDRSSKNISFIERKVLKLESDINIVKLLIA